MAGMTPSAYAASLRSNKTEEKPEDGPIACFVPQLSKVKTSVTVQSRRQLHLLFTHEADAGQHTLSKTARSSLPSPTCSYRKQGDQEYYTEENLQRRMQLLENPRVVGAIYHFWDTFPSIRNGSYLIGKTEYVDVFIKFYKALVSPQEFSVGEARQIVEKDWKKDSGNTEEGGMTKEAFTRALFEVVDIWTTGIGVEIYESFLFKLFNRVTMTIFDSDANTFKTVFADLARIESLEELMSMDPASMTMQRSPHPIIKKKAKSSSHLISRPPNRSLQGPLGNLGGSLRDVAAEKSTKKPERKLKPISRTAFEAEKPEDGNKGITEKDMEDAGRRRRSSFQDNSEYETSQYPTRLALPSIYLNSDVSQSLEAERAARRKLRDKLRQTKQVRSIMY